MTKLVMVEVEGPGPQWINPEHVQQVAPHGQTDQRAVIKFRDGSVLIFKGSASQAAALLQS